MNDPTEPVLRFELLGELRVWRDGSTLTLGPLQQRIVLAVLLLHANRPIGRAQLIDAVWGEAAPAYAVNLVQKHVSGLRRALEPGRPARSGSGTLSWTDAGYVLAVPPGGLDLEVFDRELNRGRAARAIGEAASAAEAFRAAVRLWRGPPFDGLSSPLLDAKRDWLTERWIGVTEERIDIDLELGAGVDLISELRNLVAEFPVRERLRQLLMLALYRSDRQAEALDVFQSTRAYLNDELGIEPAAPLQRLHQQILATDPSLDGPAPHARPAPARPVPALVSPLPVPSETDRWYGAPAQLPHGLPYFTGREAELKQLQELADFSSAPGGSESVTIAAVTGPAGVGKSALAVHWAHQVSNRFPDGQLYVNLRGFDPSGAAMETDDALRAFLDSLGVPADRVPDSLDGQAALYRSVIAGRRMLIVLENALAARQVRPLIPGASGCFVLVTSRNQLNSLVSADGAVLLVLELPDTAEAGRLLARRLGTRRVSAEPQAVDDIIRWCARLPLALGIVAARAATRPQFSLALLSEDLSRAQGSLDAFDGEDLVSNARAVFSWSYHQLTAEAATLFRLLGLHPGPDVAIEAAASLAGLDIHELRPTLAELVGSNLITERSPGRYGFHDLLRTYAAEQAHHHDSRADREEAMHRLLDHYLHTAFAASRLLDPHRTAIGIEPVRPGVTRIDLAGAPAALAWFMTEQQALVTVLDQTAGRFDAHIWQLAWTLVTFHDRQGQWQDSVATQTAALAAAERLGNRTGQAVTSRSLARARAQLGQHNEADALLRHAAALFESLGNLTGQADTHFTQARLSGRQGHNDVALHHARQALDLYTAAGHRAGRAAGLNAVGWFHVLLGDPDRALTFCGQSLQLHREVGDRHGAASALDSLGYAQHHLGNHDEAISHYQAAIELWRELGDRYNEADTLTHLGDTYHAAHQAEAANRAWERALTILDQLGHAEAHQVQARLAQPTVKEPN